MRKMTDFIAKQWLLLVLFLCSLVFLSWNLSGQSFTMDEPGTILMSQGIFRIGFPSGWNGYNLLSDNNGREYRMDPGLVYLWTWQPPVQSYLAFIPLVLVGVNVVADRMPFVFFGAGTVAIFYWLIYSLWRNKVVAFLLSLQLLFLLPFFLYVRQVRYYSPATFFALVVLGLFIRGWQGSWSKRDGFILFFASLLLFLTNYIIWLTSLLPLMALYLFKRQFRPLGVSLVTVIIGFIWYEVLKPYNQDVVHVYLQQLDVLRYFLNNVSYLQTYIFPLIFLPLFLFLKEVRAKIGLYLLILSYLVEKLIIYSIFLPPHGRYLMDLYPVCLLLYGFVYVTLLQKRQYVLFGIIFVVLTTSNIVQVLPRIALGSWNKFLWYPHAYQVELTGQYHDLFPQLARYFHRTGKKGDLFWSNNFMWRIVVDSHVASLSPVCNATTNTFEGPASVTDPTRVKWFIFFQDDPRLSQTLTHVPCLGEKWQKKLMKEYTKKTIPFSPGTVGINVPDIVSRLFPPPPFSSKNMIIYERKL